MDIAAEKVKLISWVADQDESVIKELIKWKQEHVEVTVEEYNQDLERAESAINDGEFTTHDQAVKRIGSWRE